MKLWLEGCVYEQNKIDAEIWAPVRAKLLRNSLKSCLQFLHVLLLGYFHKIRLYFISENVIKKYTYFHALHSLFFLMVQVNRNRASFEYTYLQCFRLYKSAWANYRNPVIENDLFNKKKFMIKFCSVPLLRPISFFYWIKSIVFHLNVRKLFKVESNRYEWWFLSVFRLH